MCEYARELEFACARTHTLSLVHRFFFAMSLPIFFSVDCTIEMEWKRERKECAGDASHSVKSCYGLVASISSSLNWFFFIYLLIYLYAIFNSCTLVVMLAAVTAGAGAAAAAVATAIASFVHIL